MVTKWENFNASSKSQFYPIGYEEEQNLQQEHGQEYKLEFHKQAIRMCIYLEDRGVVVKYLGGPFKHI